MKEAIQLLLEDIRKSDLVTQELLSSLCFHEEIAGTKQKLLKVGLTDEF